jgi:hypothetical protein
MVSLLEEELNLLENLRHIFDISRICRSHNTHVLAQNLVYILNNDANLSSSQSKCTAYDFGFHILDTAKIRGLWFCLSFLENRDS